MREHVVGYTPCISFTNTPSSECMLLYEKDPRQDTYGCEKVFDGTVGKASLKTKKMTEARIRQRDPIYEYGHK